LSHTDQTVGSFLCRHWSTRLVHKMAPHNVAAVGTVNSRNWYLLRRCDSWCYWPSLPLSQSSFAQAQDVLRLPSTADNCSILHSIAIYCLGRGKVGLFCVACKSAR
jgi:hypothetical protein